MHTFIQCTHRYAYVSVDASLCIRVRARIAVRRLACSPEIVTALPWRARGVRKRQCAAHRFGSCSGARSRLPVPFSTKSHREIGVVVDFEEVTEAVAVKEHVDWI